MALGMKIVQKLSQQQVMTPQLQQAIKLLTLSHLDLVDAVEQEMVENPALEVVPGGGPEAIPDAQRLLEAVNRQAQADEIERANGLGADGPDWQKILDAYSSGMGRTAGGAFDELPPIETNLASSQSLVNHLLAQLQLEHCTDGERVAAAVIITNLDDQGFLALTLEEVAEDAGVDLDEAEGAQILVQGLEPVGCGSRDLVESLRVQARERWPDDPFVDQIIAEHLGDFERRAYEHVARVMDLELEDVIEYHKMIQTLEPRPARGYADADPRFVTPDVVVEKIDGEWQVVLNDDGLPKLRISPYYRQILAGGGTKEVRAYLKDKLASADFLIKSIYRRQSTIHKVVESIVKRQVDFFERGVDGLRPMVLRDVADEIGMHESTVSRVTSNKYLQCSQGIFELKFFFSAAIHQVHGEDVSALAVKNRIKQLVGEEDPRKPLSDSDISTLLRRSNISCARRTVAKYREQLGIMPSSQRKRVF